MLLRTSVQAPVLLLAMLLWTSIEALALLLVMLLRAPVQALALLLAMLLHATIIFAIASSKDPTAAFFNAAFFNPTPSSSNSNDEAQLAN